jgi:DNA invertase Pin-like site-specific DNA recombinase
MGYARVSMEDQSLDIQLDAFRQVGCERVFTDTASAATIHRPGLSEPQSHLRESNLLVVWKLDRFGRLVKGLVDVVGALDQQGVQFRRVTDGIDTTTPHGRFFFHLMASLAQRERERIAERTTAGLNAARRQGRMVGRTRRMTPSTIASATQLLGGGMSPREVAHTLGYRSRRSIDGYRLHAGQSLREEQTSASVEHLHSMALIAYGPCQSR